METPLSLILHVHLVFIVAVSRSTDNDIAKVTQVRRVYLTCTSIIQVMSYNALKKPVLYVLMTRTSCDHKKIFYAASNSLETLYHKIFLEF